MLLGVTKGFKEFWWIKASSQSWGTLFCGILDVEIASMWGEKLIAFEIFYVYSYSPFLILELRYL